MLQNLKTTDEIQNIIHQILYTNKKLTELNIPCISLNIEGDSGIGKTSIVTQLAQKLNIPIKKLNLSMITVEDLIGYPIVLYKMCHKNSKNQELENCEWIPEKSIKLFAEKDWYFTGEYKMNYAIPGWLSEFIKEDKPMILLLDDYNRASLQLAQAVMELIETGGYISWNLPKGSTVILTSNPEDEDYIVTSTDDAQKTRYMTYKMKFSVKEWVDNFAEKLELPSICINFVLQHPEIFEFSEKIENKNSEDSENTSEELSFSKKTNIRIWTKFFLLLKNVKEINENAIYTLGGSSIPVENLISFVEYLNKEGKLIPEPKTILQTNNIKETIKDLLELTRENGNVKSDINSILSRRLLNYIVNSKDLTNLELDNYKSILMSPLFTEDLYFLILKKLNNFENLKTKIVSDPLVAQKFLTF